VSSTPQIVRPQARPQAQADERVAAAALPRFIEKSRIIVIRAGRWHLALALAMVLMALGIAQQSEAISVPMVDWLVPAPVLVTLVITSVGLLPLYSRFHRLDRNLAREGNSRLLTFFGTAVLIMVGCLPALRVPGVAPLVCVLVAAGTIGVVIVGEYAWLVGLTLGLASIFMDGSVDRPVTALLNSVSLSVWLSAAALAGVCYWRFGPLESRR